MEMSEGRLKTVFSPFNIQKLLQILLAVIAAAFCGVFLVIVFNRIRYPFALEWLEGDSVGHVSRILAGDPIYVKPSLDFIPFIYTPFYFYVSAAVSSVLGAGLFPLRLVSFVSSLGTVFLIFFFVRNETRNIFLAFLSASLFLATFAASGGWLDLARVDSLFLFLLLAALYLLKFRPGAISYLLAGLIISLSFLTKQSALAVAIPLMLYTFLVHRRLSLYFIIPVLLILIVSTFFFDRTNDGWYSYYVFELPSLHPLRIDKLISFWTYDLAKVVPIACALAVFYLLMAFWSPDNSNFLFYFLLTGGMVAGSLLGRMNWGGYVNTMLPAYSTIAILFGLGLSSFFDFAGASFRNPALPKLLNLAYLLCIFQFVMLAYRPADHIPNNEDLLAGRQFVNRLSNTEGSLWVYNHPMLTELSGKAGHASGMMIWDILKHDNGEIGQELGNEIRKSLEEGKFTTVVLDQTTGPEWIAVEIEKLYGRDPQVLDEDERFWPVTGYLTSPKYIFSIR